MDHLKRIYLTQKQMSLILQILLNKYSRLKKAITPKKSYQNDTKICKCLYASMQCFEEFSFNMYELHV
jgi:hypothetical protein